MIMKRTALAVAFAFVAAASAPAGAVSLFESMVLPAWYGPTFDPDESVVPRRRPGHPLKRRIERPADPSRVAPAAYDQIGEIIPVPDRWRIMEALGQNYPWYDPYNQNLYKADKPIRDGDWFLSLVGISDTIVEPRSIPVPVAPVSSREPGDIDIFGTGDITIFAQTFLAGFVYYKGNTTFKPPDWEYRLTLGFQYNRVDAREDRLLQVDSRKGNVRDDGYVGLQELFVDKHLRNVSDRYDFDSLRIGIQPFSSDFRGFLFQDNQLGVRLFGNRENNRYQYNLAWFRRLEKDTNSGLNAIDRRIRDDDVFIANFYAQDYPRLGFTSQATVIYNRNRENEQNYFNTNSFLERPSSLGTERLREYDVVYFGLNGDGRLGLYNLTASAYLAVGEQTPGTFVDTDTDIRAGFVAAELSRDFDWIRVRLSGLWASGDDDPYDDRSTGFDAIFENPIFAGADTSYWIRQNVPLIGGGGVALSGRNGVLNSLRPSKEEGQSNFDNPGTRLLGVGADFDLTPESRVSVNLNQLWFDTTEIVEAARNQQPISRNIGQDLSVSWIWRPFMTQNIVLRLSAAGLNPGSGYADLYGDGDWQYSVLGNLIFTY
jgi:hypothetical protein